MTYRLIPQNGDTVPVPQLVFAALPRAGGELVRALEAYLPPLDAFAEEPVASGSSSEVDDLPF